MLINSCLLLLCCCCCCCWSADQVRLFHDGRVMFDLLAALKSQPVGLSARGLSERISTFHSDTKVLVLHGAGRNGRITSSITKQILTAIAGAKDFTFVFTLKQQRTNAGAVISFTNANSRRFLELQSSWRREELRLHYITSSGSHAVHVEKLSYQLADNRWHQVALTISGDQVQLMVDCRKIYERVLYKPIYHDAFRQPADLWLGQRGFGSSFFEGEIHEAGIIIGKHGWLEQCPHSESSCPTCGQHKQLTHAVELLQSQVQQMQQQLLSTNQKLQQLSQCDCIIRCKYNGTFYENGQTWDIGNCHECHCSAGNVTCRKKQCPSLSCSVPVHLAGSCCPTCLRSCDLYGVVIDNSLIEHGMNFTQLSETDERNNRLCVSCHCHDGSLECYEPADHRNMCPPPDCPLDQQRTNSHDCCPFCADYDYCSKGHKCSPNARCVNLHNRYDCECLPGYHGNGIRCQDVNECENQQQQHKCDKHSQCVNKIGSYECHCLPGYSQINDTNCEETNECNANMHKCSQFAKCINTRGSYRCECQPGYHGDGINCQPICQPQCSNGGACISPGVCSCRTGFHGDRCQLDLDECALNLHKCHRNSHCVNLPGSYHCVCNEGFTDNGKANLFGSMCKDVNECLGRRGRSYTCPRGSSCVNTVGGYKCLCYRAAGCSRDCLYRISSRRQMTIKDGNSIRDEFDLCSRCKCQSGFLNCSRLNCNCSQLLTAADRKCCPGCMSSSAIAVNSSSCWDAAASSWRASGEKWTSECEICYCLNGETQCHPIKCPAVSCPNSVMLSGSCCPQCQHEDPCQSSALSQFVPAAPAACTFGSVRHEHGSQWNLTAPACVQCQCKNGHVCCSHLPRCRSFLNPTAATVAQIGTTDRSFVENLTPGPDTEANQLMTNATERP